MRFPPRDPPGLVLRLAVFGDVVRRIGPVVLLPRRAVLVSVLTTPECLTSEVVDEVVQKIVSLDAAPLPPHRQPFLYLPLLSKVHIERLVEEAAVREHEQLCQRPIDAPKEPEAGVRRGFIAS